jgi:hypothetical protein
LQQLWSGGHSRKHLLPGVWRLADIRTESNGGGDKTIIAAEPTDWSASYLGVQSLPGGYFTGRDPYLSALPASERNPFSLLPELRHRTRSGKRQATKPGKRDFAWHGCRWEFAATHRASQHAATEKSDNEFSIGRERPVSSGHRPRWHGRTDLSDRRCSNGRRTIGRKHCTPG